MNRSSRWTIAVAATLLTVVGAGTLYAGWLGFGPLQPVWRTETHLEPQAFGALGPGGDPLVLPVAVTWTKEGWCSGQFEAEVTETPAEVRVGAVVSRESPNMDCAGLGTAGNLAWVDIELAAPLGDRKVVRVSDGAVLPLSQGF